MSSLSKAKALRFILVGPNVRLLNLRGAGVCCHLWDRCHGLLPVLNIASDIRRSEAIVVIRRISPEIGCVLRIGDNITVLIFR